MENNQKLYIVSVYSENQVGLLTSISNIFSRRNLDIYSLNVFPSEFPGVHHFTFRLFTTEATVNQLVKLIEKKVDVLKAFYFESDQVNALEHENMNAFLLERNKR